MSEQAVEPVVDDELGPISCVAVEFPAGRITGAGFDVLVDLVDRDVIRVLDLEFVAKRADGSVEPVAVTDVSTTDGFGLAIFDGASSGLVDETDLAELGETIGPDSIAAILVYEERSVLSAVAAWERAGARIVSSGQVAPEELLLALDTTEPG